MPSKSRPGIGQVAPSCCSPRQHDGVVLVELAHRDVAADVGVRAEHRALGLHLVDAALEEALLHLELGDAVAQQATDPVGALVDNDVVSRAGELLCGREPSGPRADDGHALARLHRRRNRHDPAFVPRAVDDGDLDLLDRHRILVDAEHTRRLTRRRTEPAGELGEVVGGVQPVDGIAPVLAVDEVVPVGDQVPQRTAVVAEGDAAVHAARGLRS